MVPSAGSSRSDHTAEVGVEATLDKNGYFPGEQLHCLVRFCAPQTSAALHHHVVPPGLPTGQPSSRRATGPSVILEWATVQVHGHTVVDHRRVPSAAAALRSHKRKGGAGDRGVSMSSGAVSKPDPSARGWGTRALQAQTTAMPDIRTLAGEHGRSLFESPAEVVLCALQMRPDTDCAFSYSVLLPPQLPPTFRGKTCRFWYILTVCTKVHGSAQVSVLHVPVRIMGGNNGRGPPKDHVFNVSSAAVDSARDRVISPHSFAIPTRSLRINQLQFCSFLPTLLTEDEERASEEQRASDEGASANRASEDSPEQQPQDATALSMMKPHRDEPQVFNIGSGARHISRLHLFKSEYAPGEQLVLSFDFTKATVRCWQVSVALVLKEKAMGKPPLQSVFARLTNEAGDSRTGKNEHSSAYYSDASADGSFETVLVTAHQFMAEKLVGNIVLHVPAALPPNFDTGDLLISTALQFEFKTEKRKLFSSPDSPSSTSTKHHDHYSQYEATADVSMPIYDDADADLLQWKLPLIVSFPPPKSSVITSSSAASHSSPFVIAPSQLRRTASLSVHSHN